LSRSCAQDVICLLFFLGLHWSTLGILGLLFGSTSCWLVWRTEFDTKMYAGMMCDLKVWICILTGGMVSWKCQYVSWNCIHVSWQVVWGVENSNICLDSVDIYLDRWCGVLKMPIYVLKLYIYILTGGVVSWKCQYVSWKYIDLS